MTHLHLPDGALPWWLWLPGLVVAGVVLWAVSRRHRHDGADRLALLATMSALMLAAMTVPLGPLGYHLSLAPVVGMLLGSGLAFVAAAVVNGILALLGHGGISVVGINILILGTAASLGRWIYLWLAPRRGTVWAAALAATVAHAGALLVYLAVVGAAGVAPNPGVAHAHEIVAAGAVADGAILWREVLTRLGKFALLSLPFWIVGTVIESLVAGGIMGFIARVSPSLLPLSGARGGKEFAE